MGKSILRRNRLASLMLLGSLAAHSAQAAAVTTKLKTSSASNLASAAATTSAAAASASGNSSTADSIVLYINSVTDFCVFAPPQPNSTIADSEQIEVAWCTQPGHGGRLIPDGALLGAHFVKTPDYVQITGQLQGTMINIAANDSGGELDNHGYNGKGNPIGGSVHGYSQFSNFMSDGQFCIKACNGNNARALCQHIYDTLGCDWNMPGDYSTGSFTNCAGDDTEPAGVYGTSTFVDSASATPPPAHTAGATSLCTTVASPTNGVSASSVVSSASALSSVSAVMTSVASASVANVVASSAITAVNAIASAVSTAASTSSTVSIASSTSTSKSSAMSTIPLGSLTPQLISLGLVFVIGALMF